MRDYIMIPVAFARSQAAQEIEETIKFGGLSLSDKKIYERIREKVSGDKPHYKLEFKHGSVKVYGSRFILVNKVKCKSVTEARKELIKYIQ